MDTLEVIKYGLLFLILSPGFLITLYPENKGYLLSNETNYYSIILHTFLLSFIITLTFCMCVIIVILYLFT